MTGTLALALAFVSITLPLFLDWLDQRRVNKRLERMNAKALVQIAELVDDRDELAQRIGDHTANHCCRYVGKEEWPEIVL